MLALIVFGCGEMARAQSVVAAIGQIVTESILPGGYTAGAELRTFLRSNTWRAYAATRPDSTLMNDIFSLAFMRSGGNRREAVFASALAVLEHRTIPLRLPFGGELDLPLTLETETNFERRVASLPTHVYSERVEDRDKLQHFFFSAYLEQSIGTSWIVSALGSLIETGEELFVIGGANDARDRHANADGVRFARALARDPNVRPTDCLTPNP
ncbi:MAG: hypothetical protein JSS75_01445 [Bacteroidetes bacterium]|nr:hypothetical protein [Bacteroidota bacterium]